MQQQQAQLVHHEMPANNDQLKVLKTLKPLRPHGNGAVPSKTHVLDDNATDDEEASTDFYVWGADKHG